MQNITLSRKKFNDWLTINGELLVLEEDDIKTTIGIYLANTRYSRGEKIDYTPSKFISDLKSDLYPIMRQIDLNFFTRYELLPNFIKNKIAQNQKITGKDLSVNQKLRAFLNSNPKSDSIMFYTLRKIQERMQWGESVFSISRIGKKFTALKEKTVENIIKLKNQMLSKDSYPVQDLIITLLDLFQTYTNVNIYTRTLSSLLYNDKNYIETSFYQKNNARKNIDSLLELEYRIYKLKENSLKDTNFFTKNKLKISKDLLERFKSNAIALIRYYLLEQEYIFYMSLSEFIIVQSFAYSVFEDRNIKCLPLSSEDEHRIGITNSINSNVGNNLKGTCFDDRTLINIIDLLNSMANSLHKSFLVDFKIPSYKNMMREGNYLGHRIGTLSHPILEALTIEFLTERNILAFYEIYGKFYYNAKPDEKKRTFKMDLDIIRNENFKKYLETKGLKFEDMNELAIDFHIPYKLELFQEKTDKGYQTIKQLMGNKKILRSLLVVLYGPDSDINSKLFREFKFSAQIMREEGIAIEVLSFEEYYKEFLNLEDPNIRDIFLKRLKALNDLIIKAYTDPDAFERLYTLSNYYKNKLTGMGCGKTEYEAYYGL